jgi:nitrite reductase/ring-hydroxylating ferredoxin subunit
MTVSNIIDIAEGLPHKVSEVICVKCGKRWLAIRPEESLLKDLECPKHHSGFVIETGEILEDIDA